MIVCSVTYFDAVGNTLSEADAENNTTMYEYDGRGNQVSITNALGISTTYMVYDDLNWPVTKVDTLGNQTHTTYNALGQRIERIDRLNLAKLSPSATLQ
ncbi:MAG: RHS repeat protein [Chloroflexi bacterium]|nr:RHS repeat protein [Chloroflexota bacterium]